MFIGHYGVSLAAKRFTPRVSLWLLFLAVQLLDLVFALFVLKGIEKLRIVHGFTAYNPYDLYFMPYSHSLVGALAWSALAGLAFLAWSRRGTAEGRVVAAGIVAAAVLSHFVLDVPMHTPDLPLGPGAGSPRIGLGLWNDRAAAVAAELAVLFAGGAVYLRATRPTRPGATAFTIAFGIVLAALTIATPFLPDPPSPTAFAAEALVSYVLLAAAAGAVDRRREMAAPPEAS